ncbi:MAG: flagellar export chaperone FliS [Amphibacillus sp.]|uniref:Flagellar secretion chaperone FliS n=1 Tax=Amphibacillus xylanus (strain ATCC 51415 / DSM 6626 / JCM 7361 / LMG 17667 / NBRC 15112 / Ep01) TaxID=698758 RepID=K0J6P4_AMPXN|nr:flagellar export chaperone FliS [Amphibacillus xylanus]NMA90701.1 flagellar export chaperone FliS [Amphibacillus sp.]BAM46793.1 flagellar protein FliS [Amphibacillus xylanus NBRC 15112]
MVQQPYQAYINNSVNTASPAELTLMLYNGCLKFIRYGKKGIEEQNMELKNTNIQKAQNIITELMVTLDQSAPIAKDIMPLYDYINQLLIEANIKNDLNSLDEAANLVEEFRDTWKEVIKQTRTREYKQGVQA